jgi:hypothetical protein
VSTTDTSITKRLAIIRGVGYGLRDFPDDKPGLWFGVHWGNDGYGALMAYPHDEAQAFITQHAIYNIFHLEGEFCYITDETPIRFLSLVKNQEPAQ